MLLASMNVSWESRFRPNVSRNQPAPNDPPPMICRPDNLFFPMSSLTGGFFPARCMIGKVVLCYFWAPWCQPCREQAVWLNDLWLRHRSLGLVLVGFCLEGDQKAVFDFYDRSGITFPNVPAAPEQVSAGRELHGLPTLFVLSAQGDVLRKYEGLLRQSILEQTIVDYYRKQ